MLSPPDIDVMLAKRLRREREARAWTLVDLAARSGVSRAMISKIERGEASPTAALLGRLSAAFELTLSQLFAQPEDQPIGRPESQIARMEERYALACLNVFHAGDGNLHPVIMFDSNEPGAWERADRFGAEILELCIEVGGTITGEHGVGIEKINSMCVQFSSAERAAFFAVKEAFDPNALLNPGKLIPTLARCAEYGKMHVRGGALPHAHLPRF